jgi:hypothetical protein
MLLVEKAQLINELVPIIDDAIDRTNTIRFSGTNNDKLSDLEWITDRVIEHLEKEGKLI